MNPMNIHSTQSSVASSSISPLPDAVAPGTTTATAGQAPPSLLPDPPTALLGGDMAAQIAALAVQAGQAQQDIDTKSAEAEDSVQDQAEAAEVTTMHAEASALRTSAWESGLLQVGAGACTIAGAGASLGGGTAQAAGGMLKGVGEGLSGGATIAGGLGKAAATDLEASATASKALADSAERAGGVDRDAKKSAETFVQAAIDFYREYASTKAQAQAAALHGA
jgi:hypothetical protein